MLFRKLFYTLLYPSFFSVSTILFTINVEASSVVEIDQSLIGDKKEKNAIIPEEQFVVINNEEKGNAEQLLITNEKQGDVVTKNNIVLEEDFNKNNLFKEQIEKAKSINNNITKGKIKYNGELMNEINYKYNSEENKISVDRTTMKKNGPVKFEIKVNDVANTKTGATMKNIRDAYDSYVIGDYELAVMFYKRALIENPDSIEARFGLGVSYQKLMQFDQAIECYLKLLDRKFSRRKVINNLLLAVSNKSYKDALDVLMTIDENILGYDEVLSQIGILYMKLGDNVKAISALTKAYEIFPSNAIVCYNLGILYDRTNEIDYAKHFWEYAIKNDISNILSPEDAEKLQKRLKEINDIIEQRTKNKK